jgi:hypothetical protein
VTNTLAYYTLVLITTVKSFIVQSLKISASQEKTRKNIGDEGNSVSVILTPKEREREARQKERENKVSRQRREREKESKREFERKTERKRVRESLREKERERDIKIG